jgi:hypothetical protein
VAKTVVLVHQLDAGLENAILIQLGLCIYQQANLTLLAQFGDFSQRIGHLLGERLPGGQGIRHQGARTSDP